MRIDGTVTKWNDDRGFGFITPAQGGVEVFVHVSAFPRDGQRPRLGERVTFEVMLDAQGRKQARNVLRREQVSRPRELGPREYRPHRERRNPFRRFVPLAVAALFAVGYHQYAQRTASPPRAAAPAFEQVETSRFICDDRKHCSQMRSCEEAEFFLKNCPGVMMDGDGDGIPCEEQWCGR